MAAANYREHSEAQPRATKQTETKLIPSRDICLARESPFCDAARAWIRATPSSSRSTRTRGVIFRLSEEWITRRLARSAPVVRVSAEFLPHPLLLYSSPISLGPAMASSAPTLSWITRPAVRHHKHFKGKFGTALIHCKQFSSDIPCRHPCHRLRPSGPRVGAGVEAGRPWVEESYNSRVS